MYQNNQTKEELFKMLSKFPPEIQKKILKGLLDVAQRKLSLRKLEDEKSYRDMMNTEFGNIQIKKS